VATQRLRCRKQSTRPTWLHCISNLQVSTASSCAGRTSHTRLTWHLQLRRAWVGKQAQKVADAGGYTVGAELNPQHGSSCKGDFHKITPPKRATITARRCTGKRCAATASSCPTPDRHSSITRRPSSSACTEAIAQLLLGRHWQVMYGEVSAWRQTALLAWCMCGDGNRSSINALFVHTPHAAGGTV
jgi:hypothetical protein